MSKIKLGVMVQLTANVREEFKKIKEMGFPTCQLVCWDRNLFNKKSVRKVKEAIEEFAIEITAFWCGWEGPAYWNFYEGPGTLGLVPPSYRFKRMETLNMGSDFAKEIGVSDIVTHVGFLPINPNDPDYLGVVNALKYVVSHCRDNDQYFLFETGQETPVTLRRVIEDIGLNNLGVNLDPANLLMYGNGNPVDALDVFGEYVRGVHAKDGEYPTDGNNLGAEKPLGEGRVDYPLLIDKLREHNYNGALTIEREIQGEQQIKDIKAGKKYLESLL